MQLEDLADSHKKEEERFMESMKILMRKSHPGTDRSVIDASSLAEAEREKAQALEMFAMFKKQGGEIIMELKAALQDASDRCASLENENAMLRRVVEQNGGEGVTDLLKSMCAQGRVEEQECRIAEYRSLLEEEDAIIQELQHRNKTLEARTETLRQQRDKLLDVDATKSHSFQQDYNEVMAALRVEGDLTVPKDPMERMALQQKLIQMLTSKLKAEQRERLRIEEQGARMAGEQEKMMRKFEARMKEVEAKEALRSTSPSPHHQGKGLTAPPTATTERRREGKPRIVSPPAPPQQQPLTSPGGNVRSLEMQLAEVARDLNSSLDMWAAKLNTSDAWSALTDGKVKVPPLPIPSSGIPAPEGAGEMLTSSENSSSARRRGSRPTEDTEYMPESPSVATAHIRPAVTTHSRHEFSPTSPSS
jgi:hypothetical protein